MRACSSLNFPTAVPIRPALGGGFDAFVTRLNSAGSSLTYSTFLGGSSADRGAAIALDSAGNAYVTGDTGSSNFPTVAAYQAALAGSSDAFLTKVDAAGSAFVYSTYLGGSGADHGLGVGVDLGRSAFVVGSTASTNFPALAPTQNAHGGGTTDGFITRLNPSGSALSFSTYLGGSAADRAVAVTTDNEGAAYVVGNTQSTQFPLVAPFRPTFAGVQDAFVTKLTFTHPAPATGPWPLVVLGGFLLGLSLVLIGRSGQVLSTYRR